MMFVLGGAPCPLRLVLDDYHSQAANENEED